MARQLLRLVLVLALSFGAVVLGWSAGIGRAADLSGVYVSTDDGRTWNYRSGSPDVTSVFALVADRTTPGRLLIGTDRSMWESDDAGVSWRAVGLPDGTPDEAILALAVDPARPTRVWASGERGLLRSDDGGRSWRRLGVDIGIPLVLATAPLPDGTRLYAGGANGLKASEDGGETWGDSSAGIETSMVLAIASASNGDLLIGATDGVYEWTTGMVAVEPARGLSRDPSRAVAFGPGDVAYAAIGPTLYRREGGWVREAALPLASNGDLPIVDVILPRSEAPLLAGTVRGLHSSESWMLVPPFDERSHLEVAAVVVDPHSPGTLYATASSFPHTVTYARLGVFIPAPSTATGDGRYSMLLGVMFLCGVILAARYLVRHHVGSARPA